MVANLESDFKEITAGKLLFSAAEWSGPGGTDSGSLESQHKAALWHEEEKMTLCSHLPFAHLFQRVKVTSLMVSRRVLLLTGTLIGNLSPPVTIKQCIKSFLTLDIM